MDYQILHQDTFPVVQIKLAKGEKISCERDATITRRGGLTVSGAIKDGLVAGIARSLLTSESFFTQVVSADRGPGEAIIGSGLPGSVVPLEISGSNSYLVEKGGFLACTDGVELSTKMQGLMKGLFSKEGFFIIRLSGQGLAFISSFGAAHRFDLASGEELVVDNGHTLAWEERVQYEITRSTGGVVSNLTSGEGLVCRFRGPGTVYIHTLKYVSTR